MLKKILFFLACILLVRSIYFVAKLVGFSLENLNDFGQGALLGHLLLIVFLLLVVIWLGKRIWWGKSSG